APPVIFTDDDASELTDTSWSPPVDEIDTKTPAWPPAASCWPSGGPRTNALLIVTSPTVAPAPAAAGWKASVGASRPASQPVTAGIASAPTSSAAGSARERERWRRVRRGTVTASLIHSGGDGSKS